jgi:hypothetical protein
VGGLIVLAAAAIGLIYVLRHTGQQTVGPAPAPSPPAEVKPSESYPVPLGPIAPLYGYYPAVQREQQQHVVELH